MSWAKVGGKAVCIFDGLRENKGVLLATCPPAGTIVYISGVISGVWNDGMALIVEGYPNYDRSLGFDIGWHISRFRPLVTKTIEDDIAMFKRIADTVPSLEDAE